MKMVENQYVSVIHSFPIWLPQTQTWMYNQVKLLQELGVDAHVVCDRTENLEQFAVDNIHSFENEPRFWQFWDKGLRKLRIRRHQNFLVETAKKTNVKIIHSHFGNVGWFNLGAVRKLNAKHVVTFYGMDVNKLPLQDPAWYGRYRELFHEVDLVLCEGSHMARCVVELGCPSHKVKVQHLGVDVDNIPFQPRQWKTGEPLQVLISASFREKKGITYAIEALVIVAREHQVQLTIIGDAGSEPDSQKEKMRILEALKYSGLNENTRLLGYQTHQTMLLEASNHHLFLHPSITAQDGDTEGGAPVVIIEMLANGMPVVATTHCDIPEVMGPALEHLLAPERDAVGLAKCIQILLNDPGGWSRLSDEGRKHVEKGYHWKRQAERLIEHYTEIL
ncbi:MAG: glycosyltransferase [Pseudomonadota bacterium]